MELDGQVAIVTSAGRRHSDGRRARVGAMGARIVVADARKQGQR